MADPRRRRAPASGRPRAAATGGFGRQRARGSGRVVGAMLAASVVVLTLDVSGQGDAPIAGARDAVGTVVGPVETGAAALTRPLRGAASYMSSNRSLREEVATLSSENTRLRSEADQSGLDRNRLAELDGLLRTANQTGYSLVGARVVATGPMQSFSRTVTIDAGTSSGIRPDMTVLNSAGLVGRVVDATRSTATVLLVVDTESVVGARLGSNQEIGFLRGRGVTDSRGRLDLDLEDGTVTPGEGDVVVTFGSANGTPYVAGIPIGRVESVFSTPREQSKQAVIDPYVDFTALDVVGVVVPTGTEGDRVVLGGGTPAPEADE